MEKGGRVINIKTGCCSVTNMVNRTFTAQLMILVLLIMSSLLRLVEIVIFRLGKSSVDSISNPLVEVRVVQHNMRQLFFVLKEIEAENKLTIGRMSCLIGSLQEGY